MQSLSLPMPAAFAMPLAAFPWSQQGSGFSGRAAITLLVLNVVITIVVGWISSKAVAEPERATVGNAIKAFFLFWIAVLVMSGVLAILAPFALQQDSWMATVGFLLGAFCALLAVAFIVPMRVYEIGFWRALGFLVINLVLSIAAGVALQVAFGLSHFSREQLTQFTEGFKLPPSERVAYFQRFFTAHPSTQELETLLARSGVESARKQPVEQRLADLRVIYQKLEERRTHLPPGDADALADYNRQRARYDELLRGLRADAAARRAPATPRAL